MAHRQKLQKAEQGAEFIKVNKEDMQQDTQDDTPPIVKFMLQRGYEIKTMKEVENLTLNKETINIILNS